MHNKILSCPSERVPRPNYPFEAEPQGQLVPRRSLGTSRWLRVWAGAGLLLWASAGSLVAAETVAVEVRHDQSSWILRNDSVELALTQLGGHMAPVTFYRTDKTPLQPYHVSPWQGERRECPVPVLVPLRGDFFCLPFGGNAEAYQGERHTPHGEPSSAQWTLAKAERKGDVATLIVEMTTSVRPGKIRKLLHLRDGQNVVYSTHAIEGFAGRTPLGHHATLAMPERAGAFKISHSPIQFGMTCPGEFSVPANGEYQQLARGKRFESLERVPSIYRDAPDVDASRLPLARGFADLLAIFSRVDRSEPSWLTAVNADEGWLWFSLKDPRVLPATAFWFENHGRHAGPWLGRNNCVGLEDVCAYFADGLNASASDNELTRQGIPTAHDLKPGGAFSVHYIQGVAKLPTGFREVKEAVFAPGSATFVSSDGDRVQVAVQHEFLRNGEL